MRQRRVVVIGAGMGGLAAAIDLARAGCNVTVLERAAAPGGKMRRVPVGDTAVDGGPTVFTMRWVFADLLADAGTSLEERLDLVPATILARHAWRQGGRLDLFADMEESAAAIEAFAGPEEAAGYLRFCARSAEIYRVLVEPFMAAQRPSPLQLIRRVGLARLADLWRTAPYRTMWSALGEFFQDPRLQQLFGRYATYCGSSPLQAPATLLLVAHVEQDGVWLVRGGMHRVARLLQAVGQEHGAAYRFGAGVKSVTTQGGRVSGVELADGERLPAEAVVFNGDVAALGSGMLGPAAASAWPTTRRAARSLSAVTWCLQVETSGLPLSHHNVFFAEDYPDEFRAIFGRRAVAERPTVYVCAQDRGAAESPDGPERLLVLINAPPDGDQSPLADAAVAVLENRAFSLLEECGLKIRDRTGAVVTTPSAFDGLFPGTGGALYGPANHGGFATFRRAGARSRLRGLYLAGGSVHPGPGIPLSTMSGRLAAASVLADLGA